jgi:negative regulator of sigma E activity
MRAPTATSSKLRAVLAVLLLGAAAPFARADAVPDAPSLLDSVVEAPAIPYRGRLLVTQWYGKRTHAEEMRVYVLPPDRVRREFLSPDGSVSRVAVSDGDQESVRVVRTGRVVVADAAVGDESPLSPETQRETLLANYTLVASTGERVAGRRTWRLTLRPKVAGKSWQTVWLDRDTRVILRSRRFLPHRRFASQEQFVSFEPRAKLKESLFRVETASGAVRAPAAAPAPLTLAQVNSPGRPPLPATLPGGFVFVSGEVFPVGRRQVRHATYTDGLTVVSLFQTDRPVRLPKEGIIPSGPARLPGPLRASRAGKLIQWRAGPTHYTLMGDVSRELLADIVKNLR